MVSARVVADSRGPFANTRLANAGGEAGVRVGNPVMSEEGLVGRVIGVTKGASRILLLTDTASRIPVMIDRTNARAILTGDGSGHPQLAYLRGRDPVKVGDRVLSSGDGAVLPRGLPVGTAVRGVDGTWRVALDSDRDAIDFVRILQFVDFSQLVNEAELAASAEPPPPGAPPAPPPTGPGIPSRSAMPTVKTPSTTGASATTPAVRTPSTPAPKAATPPPKAATPAPKPATATAPRTAARPAEPPQ
jgi:rod shape-determining protein MreC